MNQASEQTVDLGGVPVRALSVDGLLNRLLDYSAGPATATVCYINAHIFNLAWDDASFRRTLQHCTLVWPDGISGRGACRLAGAGPPQRLSAFYFVDRLNGALAAAGRRQFLLGARAEVVARAADVLRQRYGDALIAGWHDGYFSEEPGGEGAVIEQINASGADVLTVGMSSPQQERWIVQNAEHLRPRLLWTVGALFDFIAGGEKAAPRWLRAMGLEWAWRLAQDPSGKWRRYLLGNPLFVWRVLRRRPRLIRPPEDCQRRD